MSGQRLDDRDSIPGRGKRFFLYPLAQTNSEVYPAFYPMVSRLKRGQGVTLALTHI
jgi:hypothetical protein